MTLTPGARVGPYTITSRLGAGGMGEVYRARDSKLDRDVAIKVLRADVAGDRERLSRFGREARLLAALNHPNIASIISFEDGTDTPALIMELVEGPTLALRIDAGPLAFGEALDIAGQIALALEAAHDRGIVHRDLKPANVKVRADGLVKVLDFGLAKALDSTNSQAHSDQANSPTITATLRGAILGTAAYMAPEQARGLPADTRSDVWAFGAVLFEMLSGQRAFAGDTVADTLAAVLRADPALSALPADTPLSLRRLLRRCLQKDPKQRWQHIGDVRLELADIAHTESSTAPTAAGRRRVWPLVAAAVSGAVVAATLGGVAGWRLAPRSPEAPVTRFSIPVAPSRDLALSPDGRTLVYAAGGTRPGLVSRRLDDVNTEPIRGGEGGSAPFFSPDGAWIGFFADGKLKKVPATGGVAIEICDAPARGQGTWGDDGTIVVARPYLYAVSSAGGALNPVFGEGDGQFYQPEFLPGSKTVLVQSRRPPDAGHIEAIDLETRTRHRLFEGLSPKLTTSGEVLFARQGRIWAARFDASRLTVIGAPVPVVESVAAGFDPSERIFAISPDGSLAYYAGEATRSLVWLDRRGKSMPALTDPLAFRNPRLSPDGTRVVGDSFVASTLAADVWALELERGSRLRLTTGGYNRGSVWSPNGTQIAFFSAPPVQQEGLDQDVFVMPSAGGEPSRLLRRPRAQWPVSWSPDGRLLIFEDGPGFSRDLWVLPLGGEPRPLSVTRFNERGGVFSPDGRWVAFVTDESGRPEVYLLPFPGPGPKIPISSSGGVQPVWARNGRELFYREGDSLMAVSVQHDPLRVAASRKLFDLPQADYGSDPYAAEYDVASDGRFLAVRQDVRQEIHVVLNWAQELRRTLAR